MDIQKRKSIVGSQFGADDDGIQHTTAGGQKKIVHKGYLIKFAKLKGQTKIKSYKKRYFVLNANSLMYYADHKSTVTPKGNLLLVGGSIIKDFPVDGFEFTFLLSTPFETLVMAAKNKEELSAWKYSISKAMEYANHALRGYMIKKGTHYLQGNLKKFYVLWNNVLSFHEDHESTALTQWSCTISEQTVLKVQDDRLILYVEDSDRHTTIQFEKKNEGDYKIWKEAILECIERFNKEREAEMAEVEAILSTCDLSGQLGLRPFHNKLALVEDGSGRPIDDDWPDMLVAVNKEHLWVIDILEEGQHYRVATKHIIHRDNRARHSNLKPHAFEVAFLDKVLHLDADSVAEREEWLEMINGKIKDKIEELQEEDNVTSTQTLYREALMQISHDQYYEVSFTERKPLGIVMEQSGEWAVVKIGNFKETGVHGGSALVAINHNSVLTDTYMGIISQLQAWDPPLTLKFRKAPEQEGYVDIKTNTSQTSHRWKSKYLVLSNGSLSIKATKDSAKINRSVPLQGAVVSLGAHSQYGKHYCIRVLSGTKGVVFDANNAAEWRQWAGILYHAAAVANGAAYIVNYEMDKVREEEEKALALQILMHEETEKNSAVVMQIKMAIENEDIDELEESLQLLQGGRASLSLPQDFVQFAVVELEAMKVAREQKEVDDTMFREAEERAAAEAEANLRLEQELLEVEQQGYGGDGDEDLMGGDDDELEFNEMFSTERRETTVMKAIKKISLVPLSMFGGAKPPPPPPPPSRMEAILDEEDEEEEQEEVDNRLEVSADLFEGSRVTEEALFYVDPAGVDEIKRFYKSFKKQSDEEIGEYFNVIQFSIIWRLVTGEKGNLYQEMQMFNKFDTTGKGYMTEEDFTSGWLNLCMEMKSEFYLKKMKFFLGKNNIML